MINDCMAGMVDVILTKSISRFSRNLVDTLQYVRMLKDKGIAVIFEKKDFYTGKVPENAEFTAFLRALWCLAGV